MMITEISHLVIDRLISQFSVNPIIMVSGTPSFLLHISVLVFKKAIDVIVFSKLVASDHPVGLITKQPIFMKNFSLLLQLYIWHL